MFDKIYEIFLAHFEWNFTSFILPIIVALALIAALWVVLLFCSQFIKAKAKKWRESTTLKKNIFHKFIVTYDRLLRKSANAFRWIMTIAILTFLINRLLKTFSFKLQVIAKAKYPASIDDFSDVSYYLQKIGAIFEGLGHFLLSVFFVVLVAIWVTHLVQHGMTFFIMHTHNKGKAQGKSYGRRKARSDTLTSITGNLLKIVVTVIAVFTIVQNMGINITALLATAGLASVAFGFGAQTLVKDFISGFYILFEDQLAVGDQVEINSYSGVVENITMRVVRLRSQEGSIVLIPNGDIRIVKNFTTDWARVDFRYSVPLFADLELATKIVHDEVESIKRIYAKDIIGTPEIRPVEKIVDFENRSTAALFRVFIKTHSIASKLKIEMDLNKRVMSHHGSLLPNFSVSQKL